MVHIQNMFEASELYVQSLIFINHNPTMKSVFFNIFLSTVQLQALIGKAMISCKK